MTEGLRVVRGPDWNLGNEDKGEGHVGTVVKDNGDQTYDVYWDMGGKSTCRVGKDGKYDLRILDNATVGVKHLSQRCEGCQINTIIGVLWRCALCDGVNLCTPCYYLDEHDLSHPFQRIDEPHGSSVSVPKRSNSIKMKALGIFPGAKVIRGPNWDFETQDGGSGNKGKVEDLRKYGSDVGGRNAVRVRWETSGEANVYRVGFRGKVDLQCVEEAPWGSYYRDHLPVVGKVEKKDEKSVSKQETSKSLLKEEDKCVIDMPETQLEELQRGHGGWSGRMSECIGEIEVVKNFPDVNTVEIEYKGNQFHAGNLINEKVSVTMLVSKVNRNKHNNHQMKFFGLFRQKKIEALPEMKEKVYEVKVGDVVQVLKDETKAILLQQNHGGWNDDMKKFLGKVGKVVKVDSDGDVAVAFGNQAWVYNPGLLTPATGSKINVLDDKADNDSDQVEGDDSSGSQIQNKKLQKGADLEQLMSYLLLKGASGVQQLTVGPEKMFNACANGNIEAVNQLIQQNKDLVNSWHENLSPLMASGYQGHEHVVKLLLQNGAHINASNKDGMTPLMVSISGKETDSSICLIKNKADVNAFNHQGRSPAHFTVQFELYSVLNAVLEAGSSLNKQDVEGDTPLHNAIAKRSDRAVNILLSHPKINLQLPNKKGHMPLMWAAMKDHEFAVECLIEKKPSLVNAKKSDGYTALHIAAVNDHQYSAYILILKGKAQINAQNQQGLSPLHLAANQGYDKMAEILIENGADVDLRDNDGDTPLHLALRGRRKTGGNDPFLGLSVNPNAQNQERYNIAVLMLQKGADYSINNKRGNSPLEVCRNSELERDVSKFIQKNRPPSRPSSGRRTCGETTGRRTSRPPRGERSTKPSKGRSRDSKQSTSTADVLHELFAELPILCKRCEHSMANTRLLPCKHRVFCEDCSSRCRVCPLCKVPVSSRCNTQGKKNDQCRVQ